MTSQHQPPSDIVFSLASVTHDPCVFRYDHGPVKLNAPRRRGRPMGSTKNPKLKERPRGGDTQDDSFYFIHMAGNNNSNISAETRKTIRKRAAMSNDYAQQRKNKITKKQPNNATSDIVVVHEINDVDPFDAFPIKLEPYMLDLLKYYMTTVWKSFYTIESHASLNPMTDYWLPLAFYDSALLHLLIGCADSHAMWTSYRNLRGEQRPVWLKHMQKAVTIIKTPIETLQSVSDETIAAVATLALVEKTRGCIDNWRIHMEGLQRLVDLRGGLDTLESKPMVMNKVFRADLVGSIDTIQTPFFSRHYLPFSSLYISANNIPQNDDVLTSSTGFKALDGIDSRLTHCIASLAEATQLIASLLNSDNPHSNSRSYTEAANIRFLITNTQYTLLSIQPDAVLQHPAHEMCRLVLLLFSESMLNESPPRLPMCDLLVETVREHLQNQVFSNDGKDYGVVVPADFKLWALFVAASAISAMNEVLMEWYLRAIATTARVMGIDKWGGLLRVFGKFLWEEGVQGGRYLEIWNDAQALVADGGTE